jgi:hypothetical protein
MEKVSPIVFVSDEWVDDDMYVFDVAVQLDSAAMDDGVTILEDRDVVFVVVTRDETDRVETVFITAAVSAIEDSMSKAEHETGDVNLLSRQRLRSIALTT